MCMELTPPSCVQGLKPEGIKHALELHDPYPARLVAAARAQPQVVGRAPAYLDREVRAFALRTAWASVI